MAPTELLTPSAAARAKQLEIFARTRVEGFLKSHNRSRLKGLSVEFFQHRMYLPGDDLRSVDWRIFARSDRLVTREFEEFTNLDAVLAVDVSGSMAYGRDGMAKIEFARHCAAMLAYVLHIQNDRSGLALVGGTLRDYLPPGGGRKHMAELFRRLAGAEPEGATDLSGGILSLGRRIHRKSVVAVFSDGYQDPAAIARAIGILRAQGHDGIFFQVYDPAETDLEFAGFTQFRDLENGQLDATDPAEIRRAYQEVFRSHQGTLRDGLARFGVAFHPLPVQENWDEALAAVLRTRSA